LRAVFPPIMMQSTLRRRARNERRSAGELTPADFESLLVEPSEPTTMLAITLMPDTLREKLGHFW
jgi:hypothetical protein